jgi:branched-chain amino acid transport system substrate-binding protein
MARGRRWLLLLLLLPLGCAPRRTAEPIVVGHLASLSGPDRAVGEHAKQGIDLAVADVNQEANRINNRTVNVVQVDTAGGKEAAQAQTVRLITINHPVALLGGTTSSQLEEISRAAEPYGLPLVSPASLPGPPAGDRLFPTAVLPAYQGQVLGRFSRDVLKPSGVLVLADDRSGYSGDLAAAYVKEVTQGGAVRAEQANYRAEADFPGLVERVKKARPKAVLVTGASADLVALAPQLHAADPDAVLLFGAQEGSVPALLNTPGATGPAYAASSFADEALTAKGKEVAKQYHERFGQELDAPAALAFDDARLLFEAMRRAHGTQAPAVSKELLGLDNFESLTGPLSFTLEHTVRRPLFVLRLEGGKAHLAKRYDPGAK